MSPRKGQLVLVQALARLRSRGRDVTLALIGDGSERVKLEAEVARLGLHDRVTFLGALGHDAVRTSFEQADIFCLPSLAEGAPFVLMEAMASGVPVVATTVAGIPELIEHRVSGLSLPMRSTPSSPTVSCGGGLRSQAAAGWRRSATSTP
jgi:glycosyltransferase involved in cell wall biosynthesis